MISAHGNTDKLLVSDDEQHLTYVEMIQYKALTIT